ncbi:terminase [Bacillus anthracis]|uniref:terminase large subunit n=1 Tax=Bacillus TaxID=1386 RepID=UPI000BEC59C6|nr:terminase TerL endonuclease subunit [Bacillus sp. AFS051223]PED55422.1 terminase [Bacillus anthracis]PEF69756.1 terminase [Bacillus anthracis]PEZ62480.1 terminase [Bacillus anthracis]PFF18147.1 terminase [Bacillus anthracis]PFM17134.1 terminase [Bacillus anthracis]
MRLEERLMQYVYDISDGNILACKKHQWACERFLRDLERTQEDECPFYFDIEQLYDFYEWCKQFKHFKGVLAGQYIELTDFQLFVAANIFCFLIKATNNRRFLRVFIELARKNAKSQFLALIASYITFLSDQQEECYIAGWDRQQSSLVYNDILKQLGACDMLSKKYKDSYGKITHIKSDSTITPLSKEAKKTGDGTNPSLGIVDEYHAHDTSEIYDVIDSGMGARENTLMFIITTAGFNINGPCYKEYKYCSRILDPNDLGVENDEYFVVICELDKGDDIKDETNWIKANPIVATYEAGMKKLRSDLKVALDNPEKMRSFLTKRMNIWVSRKENGYMDMSRWNKCDGVIELSELKGMECTVGADLSAKIDLTSVDFEFKKDDNYIVISHSFIPEDTLDEKMKTDKVPYDIWAQQGWITVTPGSVVDYNFVKEYIKTMESDNDFKIKEICADPWNATQFMQDMEAEGYVVVEIRQGMATLSGPTKDFREQVYQKKIIHNNNPVLNWAIGNAVTKQDANENIMLDKSKATERIDPIAAVINSHVRCMLNSGEIDLNSYILSRNFSF